MMMRRNLLLIVITILGLIVTLGLQGCGDDEVAEGETPEGGEPAMEGETPAEPGMEGEMPGEPGMGGPPPDDGAPAEPGMGGPPPADGAPAEGAAAPGGADASQLVAEGMAAKHDGDYVTAREKFEAAVAASPDSGEAHWGLAWIYAEMADAGDEAMVDRAINEFETFLEIGGTQEQTAEATAALDRLR